MTEPLNREEVSELLERLGSERDEEALAAAREVHGRITAADTSWAELLVPEAAGDGEPDEPEAAGDGEPDEPEATGDGEPDEPEAAEAPAASSETDAETLALIDKLLARRGISDDFREELTGYKDDIAEGEFEAADHRYVRALYKRLSAQG